MKNILLILLLVTGLSHGQFIVTPSPYEQCDDNNDGIGQFDLTLKNSEILAFTDPSTNSVHYYESSFEASGDINEIVGPYVNIEPGSQTVFVRVDDTVNGTSEFTTLTLIVNPIPIIVAPQSMFVVDSPYDGFAIFDLTSQEAMMSNNQAAYGFSYYLSEIDMMNGTNTLVAPASYSNISNPQRIYVRVTQNTGCGTFTSFDILVIQQDDIVFIPDVNFKTKLVAASPLNNTATNAAGTHITVDVSGDGEIQIVEALAVRGLNLPFIQASSMEGIMSFTNLEELDITNNGLASLNISGLTSLKKLNCNLNPLISIDLTGLPNLEELHVYACLLNSIDVSQLPALKYLDCGSNEFTTLNVSSLTNLEVLDCVYCHLTSLTLTGANNLRELDLYAGNTLTSLNLAGLTQLERLICPSNQIESLDLSPVPALKVLSVGGNQFTELNLSNVINLETLFCEYSLLTEIDVSMLPHLDMFHCNNSNSLTYINMKTGSLISDFSAVNTPNLQFVCAGEDEIVYYQDNFGTGQPNINSFCSFTPGGDFNTVQGTVRFDGENNGCSISEAGMPFVKIGISGADGQSAAFTNSIGDYSIYAGAESFTISPLFENNAFDTVVPFAVNFPLENGSIINHDFCVTANDIYFNAEVVIAPIVPARPGFDAVYQIVYKNIGNQVLSGTIQFAFDDSVLDFISASLNPDISATGAIAWNYTNLLPFENRSFYVTFNVNSPIETPAVNIGDILTFGASVLLDTATDADLSDNNFTYNQTVVGGFDPNSITCIEGDVESPSQIGEYLHYVINFENTGNASAENIVIEDSIDTAKFNLSSLQILNSSHQVTARIHGNIIEFIFEGINLYSGGHGNILLKVKTLPTLTNGDMVSNMADIYFDYNFPVETNIASTEFQALGLDKNNMNSSIQVLPNPTKGILNVTSATDMTSLQLYDVQGRLLQTTLVDGLKSELNITDKLTGVYFLKVGSDAGSSTVKIIKN